MAQRKSGTSNNSLRKRLDDMESLLSQLLQRQNDSSGISTSSTGESSGNRSRNESTRKRSASEDRDAGGKKKRSEGEIFECTLCDGKYQKEWVLFRHYKVSHKAQSPERVHQENLSKGAAMKKSNLNKFDKPKCNVNKSDWDNNCKLCEATFNSTSARNSHYTGKHKIKDEKLLFFPDGSALVESSLEHQISKNPQWFKIVVKRNTSSKACKLCDAELDIDNLKCHYERAHKVMQMGKVETLIRLNNTDIKQVAAIKKCKHCSDTFADTEALENHVTTVHIGLFIKCKFCNKSLEAKIYNDHVKKEHTDLYFKKTDVRNTPTKVDELNKSTSEKEDAEKTEDTEKQQKATISARRVSFKPQSTQEVPLMYICDACKLVSSSYDNVIAHSQDHILNNVTKEPEVCEICDLQFDVDFPVHKQMHLSNDDLDRDSFRFVSYDYKNLTNDKWLYMFKASKKSKVLKIISASIYFSTHCIRFRLLRDCKDASAQFTLFQCMACNNYVDPKSIESHVLQRNACTDQTFSHQCIKCSKTFNTQETIDEHIKTHDIPDSDSRYRTVLFNNPSDFIFNKALLENAGKSVLIEKEVMTRLQPERRVEDDDDAKAQTPASKVTVAASQSNKANSKGGTDVENKDACEHKGVTNRGNKLVNKHKVSINSKAEEGKAADVYKCACGLCFHRINLLLEHMLNCPTDIKIVKITCACGLVFDGKNFVYHCEAHCNDVKTFNVKELILVDKIKVDVSGMAEEFKKDYTKKLSEAISEVKIQENSDVYLKTHEKVSKHINSSNEQVALKKNASESNVSIHEVSKYVDESAAVENGHQSIHVVSTKEADLENNKLYEALKKAGSEPSGETQAVDKMLQNSRNLKKREVTTENHKNMLTDVLNNINQIRKLLEMTEKGNSLDNIKNNTLESENTQENKSMVETTIDVELKENWNLHTFKSTRNNEQQPKLYTRNDAEQIKEANENTKFTLQESMDANKCCIKNNKISDPIRQENYKIKNKPKSDQESRNITDIQGTIGTQEEISTSHITEDSNIEDYDEEELLKDPENEVNDTIISDGEDPIDSEIDLMKKKVKSLFSSSSKNVEQALIDYMHNHESKTK